MIDLLPQINEWFARSEEIAVATVVRVVGSAPRPVGARMIVSSEGRMAGSVSGGCVETTVYEEMMDVLRGGAPRLLHFGITEDMIWDVGLACGGTIDVFVQKLDPVLLAALVDHVERGEPVALTTVVSSDSASGESGIGESALVTRDGTAVESDTSDINRYAQEMLATRAERGETIEAGPGAEVYIEPFLPRAMLVIVGGVHVAIPLTRFAKELGFGVIIIDPRAKFANRERFP